VAEIRARMQRWVLRVCAYAAQMTDAYPPFRLDLGGPDPDGVLSFTGMGGGRGGAGPGAETAPPPASATGPVAAAPPTGPVPGRWHWTGGRVASVVIGAMLALTAGGLLIGGTAVAVADLSQRDSAGYRVSRKVAPDTGGYVARTESVRFTDFTPATADSLLGATLQAIYYCPSCEKETERHPQHTCGTNTDHIRGWRWLNNDWVNFTCSLVGALSAVAIWAVWGA
jgi:hypothetical protein